MKKSYFQNFSKEDIDSRNIDRNNEDKIQKFHESVYGKNKAKKTFNRKFAGRKKRNTWSSHNSICFEQLLNESTTWLIFSRIDDDQKRKEK